MGDKQRIIDLQKQLRIARAALVKIKDGDGYSAFAVAEEALDEVERLDRRPLGQLVGQRP